MKYVTEGYEPKEVLQFFEDISRIPRPSFHEEAVAEYVYNWGKNLGLDAVKDEHNNVVIKKKGSAGCEDLPPVMLQGHLDMVPSKVPGSKHDFLKDPLPLMVVDGKLTSDGTTLGADNGNAVAYMMGVLADNTLVHPPVECVFTVGEEVGLLGANLMSKDLFTAKRMINLDAGGLNQSVTTVSCAGGLELKMRCKPIWQEAKGEFISLYIHGLKGGHSAGAINEGRGNAGKLVARIINHVSLKTKTVVATINGGDKMNAILDTVKAVISVEDLNLALETINKSIEDIKDELRVTDPGFVCEVEHVAAPEKMLDDVQSKHLVQFALTIPSTVRDMSFEIKGHVLCSNNLAAIQVSEDEILLWTLGRSGDDSRQEAIGEEIKALAEVFGYDVEVCANFSGWKYNPNSKMRELHKKLFKEKFGIDLQDSATHGGLETGVFYAKDRDLDIIAMGPITDGEHTPDEWLDLKSFKDMYEYLCYFLEGLTK